MNNNMNDAPTKEELLAAGATHKTPGTLYIMKQDYSQFQFYLNPVANSFLLYVGESLLKEMPYPSKQKLNEASNLLWDKELDFTPKEKTYNWEEVLKYIPELEKAALDCFFNTIDFHASSKKLRKKITALVKLEYIIKAIEADCKADKEYNYEISFKDNKGIYCDRAHDSYKGALIVLSSEKAAETLIKHHPDLIKDALGVVC